MKIMPQISIIIPIYQVEDYIENTIMSVCTQVYTDFEVLLVNNNTRDKSLDIACSLLDAYHIRYTVLSQPKQGLAATRNLGFCHASGNWVISIDSDDVLSPLFLKELHDFSIKDNLSVVTCKYSYVDENHLFAFPEEALLDNYRVFSAEEIRLRYLKRNIPIMITNTLFEKSFLLENQLSLNEEMLFGADLEFMWRVLFVSDRVGVITKSLYNYFNRPDSMMTAPGKNKIKSRIAGFEKLKQEVTSLYDSRFAGFVYYRELLGLLATLSQYGSYQSFKESYDDYYDKNMNECLKSFPDYKVRAQNRLLRCSPLFYYNCNRIIRMLNRRCRRILSKYRWR